MRIRVPVPVTVLVSEMEMEMDMEMICRGGGHTPTHTRGQKTRPVGFRRTNSLPYNSQGVKFCQVLVYGRSARLRGQPTIVLWFLEKAKREGEIRVWVRILGLGLGLGF